MSNSANRFVQGVNRSKLEYQRMMGILPSFRFACGKTHAVEQLGLAVTPAAAGGVNATRTQLARGL